MAHKILIVDDEPDMRRILKWLLAPYADVLEAASGEEALRLLRVEKPRLALLDIAMPDLNGVELLAAVRDIDPGLVCVMLTGVSDLEVAKRALDLGARSYITKPFNPDLLLAEVQRCLSPQGADSGRPWRVHAS